MPDGAAAIPVLAAVRPSRGGAPRARRLFAEPWDDGSSHARLTAEYALILADVLGIADPAALRDLYHGAVLHDVGKAVLPRAILLKPGTLSPLERAVMRDHPVIGYGMIARIPGLEGAAGVVLHHHERFDGRGYPSGLAGRSIPRGARIAAVADAVEAITADRPYRPKASFALAAAEIGRGSGGQFDPEVASACLAVPLRRWLAARTADLRSLRRPLVH